MIDELSLLHGDYNGDPNIKVPKTRGFLDHGSTFVQSSVFAAKAPVSFSDLALEHMRR